MTVLDNGALMTSYLKWRGVNTAVIGAGRGVGAISGLIGTFAFPWLIRRGVARGFSAHKTVVTAGSRSVWFFWFTLAPCLAAFIMTGESRVSDYTLIGSMAVSRIWLWSFDLAETQIMQEMTGDQERGLMNGMQTATFQLLYVGVQVLGMIFNDPAEFFGLVAFSIAVVFMAASCYSAWALRELKRMAAAAGGGEGVRLNTVGIC